LLYAVLTLATAGGIWLLVRPAAAPVTDPGRAPWEGTQGPRPIPVSTVAAALRDLPVHLKAIGTVTPLNTVTVRSRVDGQLLRVVFDEGQTVKAGQLLAEIDPAQYQIQLAQAEAQQRQNLAQLETAKRDLERFQQLHGQNLLTTQQLEAQQSLVAERNAVLAADQAQVDNARLRLAYTKIEAPISGRLGLRQVDAGNLIRANDQNGLVVITQTRPIAVMFTVPEIDLQKVLDPLRAGERLEVEAWDRSEKNLLATGVLKTVDNQIDAATGTLRLKAEFANDDDELFPNQFVNVRLRVRTLADAIVIPGAAVQYGSRGTYVYVVNARDEAVVRDVVLGPMDGTMQAITQGLTAGEAVVLEGLDRLRDGRKVILTNSTPPPSDS
jgi:multidrug efflux system membrane fusion protein